MLKKLWTILTLRCEEADRLQSIGRGNCTRSERIALWIHQCLCRGCAAAARQLEMLNDTLRQLRNDPPECPEHTLSPEAQARLNEALRNKE